MNMPSRYLLAAAIAGVGLTFVGTAQADELAFGEDDATIDFDLTAGSLGGANYFNRTAVTGGVAPGAADVLFLGNDSTISNVAGESVSVVSIRVGTAPAVGTSIESESGVSNYPLGATLNVTGGDVSTTGTGLLSTIVGDGTTATLNLTGGAWTTAGTTQVGGGGAASEVGSAGTLSISDAGTFSSGNFFVGNSPETMGIVNLGPGGTLATTGFVRIGNDAIDGNQVNVSGGTWNASGNQFFVGANSNSTGNVLTQTGGAVNVAGIDGAGNTFFIAGPPDSEGTYDISGGSLIVTQGGAFIGNNGTGTLNVSDSATVAFGADVTVAGTTSGVGTINLAGGDASFDVAGNFVLGGGNPDFATLAYDADGDEDVTLVDVLGTATLSDGADISLDVSSDPTQDDFYNLLTATDITLGAVDFTGPAGYGLQVVSGGNGQILQAVIPEPTSLAVLGLGGLTLLRRRRA